MPENMIFWRLHWRELTHLVCAEVGEEYGLTETELKVLLFLREHKENTARDIVYLYELPKSNVSNAIRMLERNGYLKIQIDPENRKLHRLYMTAKGVPVAEALHNAKNTCLDEVFDGLNKEDRETLCRLCMHCDANVQRMIRDKKIHTTNLKN